MEKVNFNDQKKNIPLPSGRSDLLKLREKIESFIKTNAMESDHFHDEKGKRNQMEMYGIRSTVCSRKVNELVPFKVRVRYIFATLFYVSKREYS